MRQFDLTVLRELFKGARGKVVIAALSVLLVNIIVSIYMLTPLVEAEGLLKARVSATTTTEGVGGGLGGVQGAYDDLITFRSRLSSKEDLTMTLSKVFKAAKRQGLTIAESKYSADKANAFGISRYTVSFPVSGVYGKIKKFIDDLESMQTPLAVEELALSRSTKGNSIELNVTLSAYFI